MKKIFFILLIIFSSVHAAEAAVSLNPLTALQYLEKQEAELEKWTQVKAAKGTNKFENKDRAVKKVLDILFDYDFIARYVIGQKWDTTPEGKRDELFKKMKELFSEFYLEGAFYNKSYEKKYIERTVEEMYIKGVPKSVNIVSEIQVTLKKKPVIYEVIYHMHILNGSYKIFDIELDGVSLVRNYRTQFKKSLAKSDVDELIKKIDKKLKKTREKRKNK